MASTNIFKHSTIIFYIGPASLPEEHQYISTHLHNLHCNQHSHNRCHISPASLPGKFHYTGILSATIITSIEATIVDSLPGKFHYTSISSATIIISIAYNHISHQYIPHSSLPVSSTTQVYHQPPL